MPKPAEEAARLYAAWQESTRTLEQAITDAAMTRAGHAEQEAYDALIEFLEEHDLNYSEWDPRGPDDPDYG